MLDLDNYCKMLFVNLLACMFAYFDLHSFEGRIRQTLLALMRNYIVVFMNYIQYINSIEQQQAITQCLSCNSTMVSAM